ncbi:MAG TPA: response regulator transcription factor [Trueperaceae bacterium]
MSARVLVVEDEAAIRHLLAFHLSQAGFRVLQAATLSEAWEKLHEADMVVLDWMMPDGSGVDWLRRVRLQPGREEVPVLLLTARASESDKVEGFELGADDYLTKPFSAIELAARLRALLRRTRTGSRRRVGGLVVDEAAGSATFENELLQLTRREYELIAFLAGHPGRIFSRGELLDRVWGEDFLGTERTVDQHIAQLRSLIGGDYIETIRGRGYRLVDPEHDG